MRVTYVGGEKTLCLSRSPKQKERQDDLKLANFLKWRRKSSSGWMRNDKMHGYGVSRLAIRLHTLRLAKSGKYAGTIEFKASQGWCTRILDRHDLALRQRTKIAQKLPKDHERKIVDFQQYVIQRKTEADYPLCRIGNMDETPMCFDMPSTQTVNKKGEKTVMIKTTGHEKTLHGGSHLHGRWG